eukprot:TRINITY_DN10011_c1_g2_i1.p1 TRINITY_DN10011_c1_g2~~TRINITY_DN10011_c1_g2_i1.p1  ORF type:complete len:525 (+),score=124.51 TRINITY_DN10011_c1_g2_i1:74-1648(+)
MPRKVAAVAPVASDAPGSPRPCSLPPDLQAALGGSPIPVYAAASVDLFSSGLTGRRRRVLIVTAALAGFLDPGSARLRRMVMLCDIAEVLWEQAAAPQGTQVELCALLRTHADAGEPEVGFAFVAPGDSGRAVLETIVRLARARPGNDAVRLVEHAAEGGAQPRVRLRALRKQGMKVPLRKRLDKWLNRGSADRSLLVPAEGQDRRSAPQPQPQQPVPAAAARAAPAAHGAPDAGAEPPPAERDAPGGALEAAPPAAPPATPPATPLTAPAPAPAATPAAAPADEGRPAPRGGTRYDPSDPTAAAAFLTRWVEQGAGPEGGAPSTTAARVGQLLTLLQRAEGAAEAEELWGMLLSRMRQEYGPPPAPPAASPQPRPAQAPELPCRDRDTDEAGSIAAELGGPGPPCSAAGPAAADLLLSCAELAALRADVRAFTTATAAAVRALSASPQQPERPQYQMQHEYQMQHARLTPPRPPRPAASPRTAGTAWGLSPPGASRSSAKDSGPPSPPPPPPLRQLSLPLFVY